MKKYLILLALILAAGVMLTGMVSPGSTFAKKLIVAIGQEPNEMDLNLAASGSSQIIAENWGEWLVMKSPNGDLVPGLATSWEWTPDYKEIVFTLRKGVKWHSGDDFTAQDVVFSFQRGQEKNSIVKSRLRTVEKFEALDDYHFKVTFKAPDVAFIANRGSVGIVSKAYTERVGEEVAIRNPVGTGPYKVVKYQPAEYIDIVRFEDYWGPKPQVEEARFVFTPEDTTRVAKLKAGEADIINAVPWALLNDIKKTPHTRIVTVNTDHPSRAIIFSTRNPKVPWHDSRVRMAMAYAIDRNAIVKDVLNGIPNAYGYMSPSQLGYDPADQPWPYDPKKAKQLLAEAGYPNGFEFDFYHDISGRVPMTSQVVQVIAAQLAEVGIKANLKAEEYEAFYARRRGAKKPEAVFVGYFSGALTGAPHPAYTLDLYFHSKGAFSIYANPELDKLIEQARSEVDEAKNAAILSKAVKLMYQEVPTIPIFNSVAVWAMKDNINFTPTQKHNFDIMSIRDITVD